MGPALPRGLDAWLAERCGHGRTGFPADLGDGPGDDLGTGLRTNLAEAVRKEQLARLRTQLDYARTRSPFYRERLRGLAPGEFSWKAFTGLPFTSAEDLRDWKKFLCLSQDEVERVVTLWTSGTSGPPKRLAFSRADLAGTRDFFQAGMGQLVRGGDRALALWPHAERPHGVGALLREALGAKGVTVFTGDPLASPDSLRREIETYNPRAIIAAPRQLGRLAALLSGGRPPDLGRLALRGILSSAESLPAELALALRSRYGFLVLDHYGLTESGYGGGVECPAHDGYHLRELDLVVEIVGIESGAPLDDGEEGEIVMTTLAREAMPLIRYRTGDVSAMRPGPCRCGSPLRRLSPIRGRIVRANGSWRMEQVAKGSFCENIAHASL